MFGFEKEESRVSWSVENAGDTAVRFANIESQFDLDNPPEVFLGGQLLVRAGDATLGTPVDVPAFDEVQIGPGEIRKLSVSYPWAIRQGGYAIILAFDNGCELKTEW